MMTDHWNHANYSVAEGRIAELEACIDQLFPWQKTLQRPDILGYQLLDNPRKGAIYFRPTGPAGRVADAITRLRRQDADLDEGLRELEARNPDFNDHAGFVVESPEEWERRVAQIERESRLHPEWQVSIHTFRPGIPPATSKSVYQAFIRIGLLGPFRNTFEMQAVIQNPLPVGA